MAPHDPTTWPADEDRRLTDLAPSELLVVSTLRAWTAPLFGEEGHDWRATCRSAGIGPEGQVGFEVLMSVVGASAQRLLEVRCPGCPSIGADEAAMLRLIAALQAEETLGALEVLADWLPEDAVGPALQGARGFARAAATAGLGGPRLPRLRLVQGGATRH